MSSRLLLVLLLAASAPQNPITFPVTARDGGSTARLPCSPQPTVVPRAQPDENRDLAYRARCYRVEDRIYQVLAVREKGKDSEGDFTAWSDSFSLLKIPAEDTATQGPPTAPSDLPPKPLMAYALGEDYSSAFFFHTIEKEDSSASELRKARLLAVWLGMEEPPPPAADYKKNLAAIAAELEAKHGLALKHLFLAANSLSDASIVVGFGRADLGNTVRDFLENSARYLSLSGIPQTVWSAPLAGIRANPTRAAIDGLRETLRSHLAR